MMPIRACAEPEEFEAAVRSKGRKFLTNSAIAPPVPSTSWRGREYWRNCIRSMHELYGGLCAFTAFRIELVTGAPSVEHFKPKKHYPHLAYEWSNFRLICSRMNGRKGEFEDVLDPFEIPKNTFDVNPISGAVEVHAKCRVGLRKAAQATIDRLKLSDPVCNSTRLEHLEKIRSGDWSLAEGERQSPFVVFCMREQGQI